MTSENTALPTGGTETTISADTDRPVPPAAATLPATSLGGGVGKGVGKGAAPRRSQQPELAAAPTGPMAEMDDNVVLVAFTEQSRAYEPLSRLRQAADPGLLEVRAAALLERGPDGVVRVPDSDDVAPASPSRRWPDRHAGRGARRPVGCIAGHLHRHADRQRRRGGPRR